MDGTINWRIQYEDGRIREIKPKTAAELARMRKRSVNPVQWINCCDGLGWRPALFVWSELVRGVVTYGAAKKKVFASAEVHDGYNGHRARVELSYIDGWVYEVHSHGCHKGPLPQAVDRQEAWWMVLHSKHYLDAQLLPQKLGGSISPLLNGVG